jgi:UDPglucose 6-dehydrogenase
MHVLVFELTMIISVYGAGYVGLVSATCLAKLGHEVFCVDINAQRVAMLLRGECPIYEEQLPELLQEQVSMGKLHFTADLSVAIKQAEVHIIATATPNLADGQVDLSQVFAVVSSIVYDAERDGILVTKSTVPVGTGDVIQALVDKKLALYGKKISLAVTSNPEFLREGTAVVDFLQADRIIIGGEEEEALAVLELIYQPLVKQGVPLLRMSRRSAELTKYSANAMLACRISFINQISQLAAELGANIDDIRQGIALDPRIGPLFLQTGIGYGGSCFPKDVRALAQTAKAIGVNPSLLEAIETVNQLQKNWVFEQLTKHFTNLLRRENVASTLKGLTVGIWGLSFKPGTDDLREASSLVIINTLLQAGVILRVFDPVAIPAAQKLFNNNEAIYWCDSPEAIFDKNLHALVIATEWPQFKNYRLDILQSKLGEAPLIDGRNCFELSAVIAAQLPYYYSVGRPPILRAATI